MKKFHPTEHCVKCGSKSFDIEYRSVPEEFLFVRCRTCGYAERFLPLDAKVDV